MSDQTETLAALLRRYRDPHDEPREVIRVSFAEALLEGDDPLHILSYLAGLGVTVRTVDDLLRVGADGTEEDLACFRVAEGVAVCIASDGIWMLFEP